MARGLIWFMAGFFAAAMASKGHAAEVGASEVEAGWAWLAQTNEIEPQGVIWNDYFGDGKDRWKTGGLSQSYIFPERIFSARPWFADRASALELNARAYVMTPDDTSRDTGDPDDRPYAQYAAAGLYLRSIARPRRLASGLWRQDELRLGVELGWQGDPLPLFDVQNGVHGMTGTGGGTGRRARELPSEFLANLEARHTWRFHFEGEGRDIELAPFAQVSAGMRENSLRLGADILLGTALEGRTWGYEPATGAVIAGAMSPRPTPQTTLFVGADIGFVASDAFLDGGATVDGPSVERELLVPRARAGLLFDYGQLAFAFSLNWLGPEFETQSEGQLIGAFQIKYRF